MVPTDLLRKYVYFSDLREEGLQKLASIAEEIVVPAGERIFSEYDPADRFYLIVGGEVKLQTELGSGEMREVDTLVACELFAWSAFVEPYRFTATCTALQDTRLVGFDAVKLRQLCDEDKELGYELMDHIVGLLVNRLESARVQLAAVSESAEP